MRVWECKHIVDFYFITDGILPSKEFYQGYIGTQYGTNPPNLLHFNIHWRTRIIKETKWQFWTFKTKQLAFGQGLLTLTEKVQRAKKIICEV